MPKIVQICYWVPPEKRMKYFIEANKHMDIKIEGEFFLIRYKKDEKYVKHRIETFFCCPQEL